MTAWCSVRRSNSDSAPSSLAATSHACGAPSSPPAARATGSASARPVELAARGEPAARARAGALAQLGAELGDHACGSRAARTRAPRRAPSNTSAGPPISAGQRGRDPVEPLLGEHDPLEPLVRGQRAPQHGVLLVDEVRERLLGERDERQLVGHLEQREAVLRPPPRRAPRAPSRARSRCRARARRARGRRAARRTRAALSGVGQLHPGGQQQLAARQERRRVLELGDVHPAHGRVEPVAAGGGAHVEIGEEVAQGQHRQTGGSGSPICTNVPGYTSGSAAMLAHSPHRLRTAARAHARDRARPRGWEPVVPLLAREREVIAVDLPGFGDSPPLHGDARRSAALAARSGRRGARARAPARGGQLARRRDRARARRAAAGRAASARSRRSGSRPGASARTRARRSRASTRWRARSTRTREVAYGGPVRRTAAGEPDLRPAVAHPGRRRRPHEPHHRARPGWDATLPGVTTLDARRCRRARPRSPGASATGCCSTSRQAPRARAGCPGPPRHAARLRARADVGRPRAGRARDPRCRAPDARPLLLVDVDGVLSLFGAGVDRAACMPALVEGIPHFLSRARRRGPRPPGADVRVRLVHRLGGPRRRPPAAPARPPRRLGAPLVLRAPRGRRALEAARDRRPRGPAPPARVDRRRPRRALPRLGGRARRARRCS